MQAENLEDFEDAVVVGIDVDDESIHAGDQSRALLGWAAAEAVLRKAPLLVCHLWEWSDGTHPPALLTDGVATEPTAAAQRLWEAVSMVRSWHPDLAVWAALGQGRPAPALLRLSEKAQMLVVGARGSGGFAGLRVGSVSGHLAAHAHCPVAVVRPPSTVGAVDVVAGVDGWPDSDRTVRLAAEQARRLGGKLILLHSYRLPPPAEYGPNAGIDEPHRRAAAEDVVDRAAEALGAAGADLDIEPRVVHGGTVPALLDAAADAATLVVGARGIGGFAGLLLGSVSQQVLRHAPCTVVVAR
jgi:nucleotide-binding universal stress UspA family protein